MESIPYLHDPDVPRARGEEGALGRHQRRSWAHGCYELSVQAGWIRQVSVESTFCQSWRPQGDVVVDGTCVVETVMSSCRQKLHPLCKIVTADPTTTEGGTSRNATAITRHSCCLSTSICLYVSTLHTGVSSCFIIAVSATCRQHVFSTALLSWSHPLANLLQHPSVLSRRHNACSCK
jgi:hypothetical protein